MAKEHTEKRFDADHYNKKGVLKSKIYEKELARLQI